MPTVATEPERRPDVLIVGAAYSSLGEAIGYELMECEFEFGKVHTAGITNEARHLDVLRSQDIDELLTELRPDIVVCTVGVNMPVDVGHTFLPTYMRTSFDTNVTGPMDLLRHFISSPVRPEREDMVKKFVAISSNSARIARRSSLAYCASKAALTMALRVAARELAAAGKVMVWGYEPGLLNGTRMTREVTDQLAAKGRGTGIAMHRMPGVPPEGIEPADLARRVVLDLASSSLGLHGSIIPFDGGEQ